jgi:hypothetical protein
MFRTPAVLIAAGTSDAGSAALPPLAAGADAEAGALLAAVEGAAEAAAVVAAGGAAELGLEPAVLLLLEQALSARAAAIATMPAAWVRGRRRSGVTDPPGSGRLSGSQYGPAFRRSQAGGRPAWCTSCWVHLSSRLSTQPRAVGKDPDTKADGALRDVGGWRPQDGVPSFHACRERDVV